MSDGAGPPFDRFTTLQRLGADRRGHASVEHARHQLFVGRDRETRLNMLVKLASRPGMVYQHDLTNEIATLATVNRELPDSRVFPYVFDHGRLGDGRVYMVSTFFDELPLAASIGAGWIPDRLVGHLRMSLEVAKALIELHRLLIFHVDLNPMNILHRVERGRPVIRIIDFESSYEAARHSAGEFYNPPTTTGYSAPEVGQQPPDARADVFSLGAVLHTALAGYQWSERREPHARVEADQNLDVELRTVLMKATSAAPAERYASISDFRTAVGGYLESIWPGRVWE